MPFQTISISDLPKREVTSKSFDQAEADALLAAVTAAPGAAATDGLSYGTQKEARAAANRSKRLLGHVLPDGKEVESRLFGVSAEGKIVRLTGAAAFGYAIWLADKPVETPAETPVEKPAK